MKLENAFKTGEFLEYRKFKITDSDKLYLLSVLNQEKGILRIKNFLRMTGYLPKELLYPILKSGLNFNDPSSPKRWIHHVIRIFGEAQVQEELFSFIIDGTHKEVMNSLIILYFVSSSIRTIRRGEKEEIIEVQWNWNDTGYEEVYKQIEDEERIKQSLKFKKRRMDFFINEFAKSDNLVVKYYLALYIKSYDNWPYEKNQLALNVFNEIIKENFPKDQQQLKIAISGNKELENYYYNNEYE